ncbi:MAG: apolipoprotein N-acyltransferase, partial [Nitrospirales bacterium]
MLDSFFQRALLAGVTGLLYPLAFPDFDWSLAGWIALLPLLLATDGSRPREAFWLGWIAGTIAFVGVMFWVITAMHLYGGVSLVISAGLMVLLSLYLGLYAAAFAAVFTWLRKQVPWLAFLAAPFLWVSLELARTYLLTGLPWGLIGYTQYRALPVIQIADHTGIYGISFLVVLVNAALAEAVIWAWARANRITVREFPWVTPTAAIAALFVTLVYGYVQLSATRSDPTGPTTGRARTLAIGLVQANIDQARKWDETYLNETLERYRRLTEQVAPDTDLVIWPEAATPFLFEHEPLYRGEVRQLVRSQGVPLLFGSPALRYHANGRPYLLNSAYLLTPDGDILGRYDKRHLVPFGEYIPLRTLLFFVDKLVKGIGDFEPGHTPALLSVPPAGEPGQTDDPMHPPGEGRSVKFGVAICYEVIFPTLVRESVRQGADFMVTITNDAWFGRTTAPFQHFGMVVLRAVENRVSFARAANTGVSGFIDPYGRILDTTPIFTMQGVRGTIPIRSDTTFYTKFGDVFAYTCAIIT